MPTHHHPLLDKLKATVIDGETFLVALSGGADSVALLSALTETGHQCRAVHCNYHLRGYESDRDENHARSIASRLGVDIDVIQCDVNEHRASHPGESIEMACRELRYTAFRQLLSTHALDSIATGHHREDNIETMLLNMLRGSGLKGLAAMRPRRGNIVRPLLDCTKPMILDYLNSRQLDYVTDSSNLSNDYRRNALRNDIIPAITRYFPNAELGITQTIQSLTNQRDLLADYATHLKARYVTADGSIRLSELTACEKHPQATLFELLNEPDYRGYNIDIINSIVDRSNTSGLTFSGTDGSAYLLQYGLLTPIHDTVNADPEIVIDNPADPASWAPYFEASIITPDNFNPQRDAATAYFDADKLTTYRRIILRHPRPGDRLYPWGMNGSRLLSDIFTDLHTPQLARRTTWVLDADDTILWLAGIRASRYAAVTSSTTRILRLHLLP